MNSRRDSVLYVVEQGGDLHQGQPCLEFSFTEEKTPTGMSAWLSSDDSGIYRVQAHCRHIEPSFQVQALNYHVANKLVGDNLGVLCINGAYGATLDLSRVAAMLGIESYFVFDVDDVRRLLDSHHSAGQWVGSCFNAAVKVYVDSELSHEKLLAHWPELKSKLDIVEDTRSLNFDKTTSTDHSFDYSVYEMVLRDHTLLYLMQKGDAKHFAGCSSVLDLGAGTGIFLDVLRANGIPATGVERNKDLVSYGTSMGLNLIASDAMDYLKRQAGEFDGVYCSHFVEHLPIDVVEQLISGVARSLKEQGVAVFTFPDPESIRSQLLGFWRDPEHVRFYHPELITNIARAQGLCLEWSSYDDAPHDVVSFSVNAPEVSLLKIPEARPSLWQRILAAFGVASASHLCQLQTALSQQIEINRQLVDRTNQLWDVNKTWAWNDNVTLRFRKL